MWIQVRSFDGKKCIRVSDLSKLTKVQDLREKLIEPFDAPVERQRLFYRGKQLEDNYSLFDYNVGLNDLIQIMVRAPVSQNGDPSMYHTKHKSLSDDESYEKLDAKENQNPQLNQSLNDSSDDIDKAKPFDENSNETNTSTNLSLDDSKVGFDGPLQFDEHQPYKLNDVIDARDVTMGAWFEAKLIEYLPSKSRDEPSRYLVAYDGYEQDDPVKLEAKHIRPRARHMLKFDDLTVGQEVMLNYNYDLPQDRGYWYDAVITDIHRTRTIRDVTATITLGPDLMALEKCKIKFVDEIFEIEKPGSQLNEDDIRNDSVPSPVKRKIKPECEHCEDDPDKKCKECACSVCGGKNDPGQQILCDECDMAYHIFCLKPPLTAIPSDDEWYCPLCKNDESEVVGAGQQLKASKKKAKMASAVSVANRDWGKGMACVGRTKQCHIVPANHFGPIPGIEVGTLWKFRVQVSEAGVHRPHVAGIHGQSESGAYSIVISGGYEDDKDDGEEFLYSGSGGRDLSGNKRTAEQSCDQILTRTNRALARNCNAAIDDKNGATAKNWRDGKPVRVVRNCKGRKVSEYAPEEGNRYDGIYKVVKYWPEKGKSGFLVWRYLFRRDDPSPAPWTKEGKKRIKQLNIEMQYPDGYLESLENKESDQLDSDEIETKSVKKGNKRKLSNGDAVLKKKPKKMNHGLSDDILKMIKLDEANEKIWKEATELMEHSDKNVPSILEELFGCICCQDVVYKPITTNCKHNVCQTCLQRSFKAQVFTCPACRADLDKDICLSHNKCLHDILLKLLPGYDAGR